MRQAWPAGGPPTPELAALAREVSQLWAAQIWMFLGEPERALEALDSVRDFPPYGTSGQLFDSHFDPVRNDPRFQAILASRGLAGRRPERLEPGETL